MYRNIKLYLISLFELLNIVLAILSTMYLLLWHLRLSRYQIIKKCVVECKNRATSTYTFTAGITKVAH